MQSMPLPQIAGMSVLITMTATLFLGIVGSLVDPRATWRFLPVLFVCLFFLELTQLPLPEPLLLRTQCPLLGAQPNLLPFYTATQALKEWQRFMTHPNWIPLHFLSAGPIVLEDWRAHHTGSAALLRGWAFPALMNLLVCVPIGALMSRHGSCLRSAVLTGFLLSLTVELTQLTATWGLYPCAYRKFDVDDLILNTVGVALGFLLVRQWTHRSIARSW